MKEWLSEYGKETVQLLAVGLALLAVVVAVFMFGAYFLGVEPYGRS